MTSTVQIAWSVVALGLLLGACAEDQAVTGQASAGARRDAAPAADAGAGDAAAEAGMPRADLVEHEWRESERSRDPFRSFAGTFVEETRGQVKSQRNVILEDFALDDLKLVGIVLGADPPLAMLVDPSGRGHTIRRGQFVGRPDVVQGGARGAAYEVNWRVDRIRDGDVVFVREDPQNPDVPSATRVIAMRPEALGPEG